MPCLADLVFLCIFAAQGLQPLGGSLFSAKAVVEAALFHNGVGSVAGFDFPIHGEMPPSDRAVPNIMVAFAMPDKSAAVF